MRPCARIWPGFFFAKYVCICSLLAVRCEDPGQHVSHLLLRVHVACLCQCALARGGSTIGCRKGKGLRACVHVWPGTACLQHRPSYFSQAFVCLFVCVCLSVPCACADAHSRASVLLSVYARWVCELAPVSGPSLLLCKVISDCSVLVRCCWGARATESSIAAPPACQRPMFG